MTTTQRLISLSRRIARDQAEFARLKQDARAAAEADGYNTNGVTVYHVRETTVKRHTRKGYTAVRVTGPKN